MPKILQDGVTTASNTTRELTPMGNELSGYGMTLLVNGDILVCGGYWTSNCALYSSVGNKWSTFASLPMEIINFAMITLHDSRPYVFGGVNSSTILNTVYTFDATNAKWTPRAPMQRPLWRHTAVAFNTNTAMVCGGGTTSNAVQSQCYKYTTCICGWHTFVRIMFVSRY